MKVRSYEIVHADLRKLHDHLLENGRYQYRAGGAGFFVLVGEKYYYRNNSDQAHLIVAQLEADTVSIDVVAAGGGSKSIEPFGSEENYLRRTQVILQGFAERHNLEMIDL